MIAAGILTALAVLVSQSQLIQVRQPEKAKVEKSTEKKGHKPVQQHHTAIAPAPTSVSVDNQAAPSLLENLGKSGEPVERNLIDTRIVIDFFKVLFRAVITPNAP